MRALITQKRTQHIQRHHQQTVSYQHRVPVSDLRCVACALNDVITGLTQNTLPEQRFLHAVSILGSPGSDPSADAHLLLFGGIACERFFEVRQACPSR